MIFNTRLDRNYLFNSLPSSEAVNCHPFWREEKNKDNTGFSLEIVESSSTKTIVIVKLKLSWNICWGILKRKDWEVDLVCWWTFVVWRWWETTSTVFHHQIKACDIVHDSHHWCFWTFTGFEPGKMADSDNVTASGRTKHEEVWRFHSLKQNYAAWLLVSFIDFACANILM